MSATAPMRPTFSFSASIVARVSLPAATARPTTAVDWPPDCRSRGSRRRVAPPRSPPSARWPAPAPPRSPRPAPRRRCGWPRRSFPRRSPSSPRCGRRPTPTRSPVSVSIRSAMPTRTACFSSAARLSCAFCSASSRPRSMAFCLNTSTAFAIAPISSVASRDGISTAVSPAASLPIAAVMPATGRTIPRPTSQPITAPSSNVIPTISSCMAMVPLIMSAGRFPRAGEVAAERRRHVHGGGHLLADERLHPAVEHLVPFQHGAGYRREAAGVAGKRGPQRRDQLAHLLGQWQLFGLASSVMAAPALVLNVAASLGSRVARKRQLLACATQCRRFHVPGSRRDIAAAGLKSGRDQPAGVRRSSDRRRWTACRGSPPPACSSSTRSARTA